MYYRIGTNMRVTLVLLWFLIPMVVLAHSTSQSSTVLVEAKNGQWTVQVRAALSAFESVVHQEYTANGYTTPEEFEDLVFNLMAKNLTLKINGQDILLKDPKIKLGHETLVVYLIDVPDDFKTVSLNNTMFQNIFKSKNTFMILKNGVNRNVFALEKSNAFATKVKLEENEFVLVEADKSLADSTTNWYVFNFLFILAGAGLIARLTMKKTEVDENV
ncbi:DUF6702 family protein [Formosa undariae]|uniref:DUF6702 family protein n=1 Tax=Formosa undariae TaxID=1325436 RepID=A0ABV5F3Z5_9FLAO